MNRESGVGDDNRTAVSDEEAMKAAYCDWIEDQRGPDGMARPAFIDVWRAAVRWAAARRDVPGGREADYRDALESIATARQEADDFDHPSFDWRLLARHMEGIARRALADG